MKHSFPHDCPICNYHGRSENGLMIHLMTQHRKHKIANALINELTMKPNSPED